ncbi:acyltransferase family protein [Nocardioides houyundeii]|uniref:acyltransferase family protein n=1 Tax=Nocardioides houyundeii TaxID=2045452 RepID=UPI000DF2FE18|nr:acyltransferase [Nocardioides houyundeii]
MAATEVQGPVPSAPTPPGSEREYQVASLTGMRGFAALMVVLIHTSGRTQYPWLGIHGYGPIALFVLSGFLLYRPWARWTLGVAGRPSVSSFAIRRAARIFPAYWVVLFVWMFVYESAVPGSWTQSVKHLALVSSMGFWTLPRGLEQTWSLGTELTWYVALPFLAAAVFYLVRRLPARISLTGHVLVLLAGAPISLVWTLWVDHNSLVDQQMWLPAFIGCFSLGALVGLVLEAERAGFIDISRGRRLMGDPFLLPGLALVFVMVGASEWGGPDDFTRLTLAEELVRDWTSIGLAVCLLVISIFSGPRAPVVRFMSSRFMQAMGRWSYGIYLWHLPLIVLLWEDVAFPTGAWGLAVWLVTVTGISTLLGAATYAWVETPTMAWSRRQSDRLERRRSGRRVARATNSAHQAQAAAPASRKD